MKYWIVLVLTGWFLVIRVFAQDPTFAMREVIEKDDVTTLKKLIYIQKINIPLENTNQTLLGLAVNAQARKVVKFLLEIGADPNLSVFSRTPLMMAVQKEDIRIVRLLVLHGANVNASDSAGNTVLMMSAINPETAMLKILIRHGASLNVRNKHGYNARDFAIRANNHANVNYLRNIFEKHLPNYFDGPYVRILSKHKIKVNYFIHDSLKQHTQSFSRIFKEHSLDMNFQGFKGDSNSYSLKSHEQPPPSHYEGINKMIVLGDVHGQFDSLKIFLQNNRVIDRNLHWTFGNGSLVFMGDIFDRGEQVTEALWFIYRLEQEAEISNGHVILLLGNHELMEMQNDLRYLSDKYFYMFSNLRLPYSKFYNQKTIIGRWLRSKNSMVTIDSFLFVHGGLHPDILNYQLPVDSVNHLIQNYLNNVHRNQVIRNPALLFLLSYNGPFWFRGMVEFSGGPTLTDEEVDKIMNFYHSKYIFVGHTYHSQIMVYNHGKIISTDVPYYLPDGSPMEALLIDNQKFLILNSKGEKKDLNLYVR